VRQDARVGEQVPLTDELFSKMRETFKEYPAVCSKPHIKGPQRLRRSLWAKGLGRRGDCGAWHVLLLNERQLPHADLQNERRKDAQDLPNGRGNSIWVCAFPFGDPASDGLDARISSGEICCGIQTGLRRISRSGEPEEVYEYQGEDEEYRVHDTPKIHSTMPLGVFLPY
jgi:hypothetical protein